MSKKWYNVYVSSKRDYKNKNKNATINPRNRRGTSAAKTKMNEETRDFNNFDTTPIFEVENVAPQSVHEAVVKDSFFVFLKPNCYYEDGVAQTDFVAYNIPMENLNLSPELIHKLNVCPTSLMKDFQTLESQAYDIKSLAEHGIMES